MGLLGFAVVVLLVERFQAKACLINPRPISPAD
jgi:hypothetical protein